MHNLHNLPFIDMSTLVCTKRGIFFKSIVCRPLLDKISDSWVGENRWNTVNILQIIMKHSVLVCTFIVCRLGKIFTSACQPLAEVITIYLNNLCIRHSHENSSYSQLSARFNSYLLIYFMCLKYTELCYSDQFLTLDESDLDINLCQSKQSFGLQSWQLFNFITKTLI